MRALEKPFHALAAAIPLTLSKEIEVLTWGAIYKSIHEKIAALRNAPHTQARDEEIAFYAQANKEFGYFQYTWRDFVAHARKSYDPKQALSVVEHVIEFIDLLSQKGLKE